MGAEVYQRLCRARAFIDHCYDHPLSLDQMSSQACFSRYHFLRLFRQAFNKTPHQYLIERRIEKAKELLSCRQPARHGRLFRSRLSEFGIIQQPVSQVRGPRARDLSRKSPRAQIAKRQVPGCFLVMYGLEPGTPKLV